MKVLVMTDEYDYSYFTFVYNEIRALRKAGIEIRVICERVGMVNNTDTHDLIPLTNNKFFRNLYLQAYKRKWYWVLRRYSYYRRRMEIINSFQPDLIHFHFGDTAVRIILPLQRYLHTIPLLVTFHGMDASALLNQSQYLNRIQNLSRLNNFNVIYVSNQLKENLLRNKVNLNKDKAYLLHYGVDLRQFSKQQYSRRNHPKIFLQISSFFEKKGHEYTIKAFHLFTQNNPGQAILKIGGDGPSRPILEQLVHDLRLDSVVEFIGWVSRQEAINYMDQSDVFVHHSVTTSSGDQEGLPNAIIEAMAMELPILSTYHSGIPELVEDGINGFLVQEKDTETYAQKMEDILKWNHLKINREKVIRGFSLEVHTQKLKQIYSMISEVSL
jgi:glycosyltransferase involved in cell wall biosynthesis